MWARVVEVMLSIWLAISFLIFRYDQSFFYFMLNDFAVAILISFFSLTSFTHWARKLHLLNFVIGLWLIILAYLTRSFAETPLGQNYMVLGVLLLMLSILPSHSRYPPHKWLEFMEKKSRY